MFQKKPVIREISLLGVLLSISFIIGYFAHFPIFGSEAYLISVILFIFPFVLTTKFCLLGVSIAVVFSDALTGWAFYCWISVVAYILGMLLIIVLKTLKNKWLNVLSIILSALLITSIYFVISIPVFGLDLAIGIVFATLIQFAIVVPISIILYLALFKTAFVIK